VLRRNSGGRRCRRIIIGKASSLRIAAQCADHAQRRPNTGLAARGRVTIPVTHVRAVDTFPGCLQMPAIVALGYQAPPHRCTREAASRPARSHSPRAEDRVETHALAVGTLTDNPDERDVMPKGLKAKEVALLSG